MIYLIGLINPIQSKAIVPPDSTSYISPVRHKIQLTGTFAALRKNHFHAGIDIRSSKGVSGDEILSIGEGRISRIRVMSGSYGKVVYIDHPEGYTSVYAHLETFAPIIEEYVKKIQRKVQQYAVDIYVPNDVLSLNQADVIGYMGNTGRSTGVHLHFEIRDSKSEDALSPALFGFKTFDDIPPVIQSVHLYDLDKPDISSEKVLWPKNNGNGKYSFYDSNQELSAKRIGIGLQVYDKQNNSRFKNGIAGFSLKVQDSIYYKVDFDRVGFDETRAINAVLDYKKYKNNNSKILLLFRQDCNPLACYQKSQNDGSLLINDLSKEVTIDAWDHSGNVSTISMDIKGRIQDTSPKELACGEMQIIKKNQHELIIPEDCEYRYTQNQFTVDSTNKSFSIERFGPPCHSLFTVKLDLPRLSNKYIVTKENHKGQIVNYGGYPRDGMFVMQLDELGTYQLKLDDKPPTITLVKKSSKSIILTTVDNYKVDSSIGDLDIYVEDTNGLWMYFEYDKKSNQITIPLSSNQKPLLVKVCDYSKNCNTISL